MIKIYHIKSGRLHFLCKSAGHRPVRGVSPNIEQIQQIQICTTLNKEENSYRFDKLKKNRFD